MKKVKAPPYDKLQKYFEKYKIIETEFWTKVVKIEKEMQAEFKIEDIFFFHCEGELAGIGNESRTMKLVPRKY